MSFRARPGCLISRLAWLVVLFAAGMIPRAATAQTGVAGLPLQTCALRAAPGMTAAALLRSPGRFDCTTPQARLGDGDFWLISQPLDIAAGTARLAVRSSTVWQRAMTVHALFADGHIVSIRSDDGTASRSLRLGAIFQTWLPWRQAKVVRLLWHVEGVTNLRGVLLAPTIATGDAVARSDARLAALYAGIGGACGALLVFNLGLAYALRHRFMPFYCLMMVALLAYDLTSSGTLAWLMPGIANTARMRLNYVLLALIAISALIFLRNFFEHGVMTPRLRRLGVVTNVAVGMPAIGIALFAPVALHLLDTLYGIAFLLLLGSIVPILYNAWRQKSTFLPFFTLAWSLPIALALVRVVAGLTHAPYSFWLDNSSILSMTLQALLSSLAIGHRILLLTRERDAALEQEIAAKLLADTDPLTGLLNRRAFLRGAIGREGNVTLLLADLDHFKRVNETIGHDGGDEVLRIFARTLRQSLPPDALVARIGGEEFAIVVDVGAPVTPGDVLARLRAERMPFDLRVTASIGSCTGTIAREADWNALYRAADRALFQAKAAGRDRARRARPVAA